MQNKPLLFLFINNFNLKELSQLKKNINLIYRNYNDNINIQSIIKIRNYCKKTNRKFYLSNNFKLAFKLNLSGVYIPSFNKKINFIGKSLKTKFEIIGSAHNIKEIKIKQKQGCEMIFLSPLFKTIKKSNYLGIIKFNLMTLNQKAIFIALGGINADNFREVYNTKSIGISGIRWLKKNGPRKILRPFLRF